MSAHSMRRCFLAVSCNGKLRGEDYLQNCGIGWKPKNLSGVVGKFDMYSNGFQLHSQGEKRKVTYFSFHLHKQVKNLVLRRKGTAGPLEESIVSTSFRNFDRYLERGRVSLSHCPTRESAGTVNRNNP